MIVGVCTAGHMPTGSAAALPQCVVAAVTVGDFKAAGRARKYLNIPMCVCVCVRVPGPAFESTLYAPLRDRRHAPTLSLLMTSVMSLALLPPPK